MPQAIPSPIITPILQRSSQTLKHPQKHPETMLEIFARAEIGQSGRTSAPPNCVNTSE
jgi:hypothetical protein